MNRLTTLFRDYFCGTVIAGISRNERTGRIHWGLRSGSCGFGSGNGLAIDRSNRTHPLAVGELQRLILCDQSVKLCKLEVKFHPLLHRLIYGIRNIFG